MANKTVNVLFAKTRNGAIIPSKNDEDAGYDVYPSFEESFIIIKSLETKLIPTGIACALPVGFYFQVEERGSTGSRGIKKSAGVIDSGYRDEIFIAITNCNKKPVVITKDPDKYSVNAIIYPYDKAIAQLVLHEVPQTEINEITYEELRSIPSIRGTGKLGSSGK